MKTRPGSECTIYGPCEEWCALFASWVWIKAGVPLEGSTAEYGYTGSLYTWAKEHGGRVLPPPPTPSPGDLVFYGSGPGPGESQHVGVVQSVFKDGRITTIEGNYAGHVSLVGPFLAIEPDRGASRDLRLRPATRTKSKGEGDATSRKNNQAGDPADQEGRATCPTASKAASRRARALTQSAHLLPPPERGEARLAGPREGRCDSK